MSKAAIFLDRDGTLIEDRGHLSDPAQAILFPDTIPALRLLQRDFALFIVSNQSGIAKGMLTPAQVERVNQAVLDQLAQRGIHIEKIYYCPHQRSDGCQCIKPNPHYLQLAARELDLDLERSFVIGEQG